MSADHLEVWGDPIAHSRSPSLHRAAYAQLGLPWSYDRRQVPQGAFAETLSAMGASLRGLSITMPLKEEAFRAAHVLDRSAQLTGAVNTLLLGGEHRGFNTDVAGLVDALREHGTTEIDAARVLGAGATAASAVVALSELGASRIEVRARRPERAAEIVELGEAVGVIVLAVPFDAPADAVDATVATLPSGTELAPAVATPLTDHGGVLLDVAYSPWPSALAAGWRGGEVISGLAMLLHQAVRQVRIFTSGDPWEPLPGEAAVVSAMRSALVGD